MERKIYVIGHRNPDTDSIVSAIAYAALKRQQGWSQCIAARAGKLTPQTEYILDRFHIPAPEYIPDLVPKVGYFLSRAPVSVEENTPLWDAIEQMQRENLKILPVVDSHGKLKAVLDHTVFTAGITAKVNPHRKAIIPTSVELLLKTLKAQPLVVFNEKETAPARIVVAASSAGTFRQHLRAEIPGNALVLVGDREDIQRCAIEEGARALILTRGVPLAKGLRELAEKKHVTVMISPYDTSSTALLILYSAPVGVIADGNAKSVNANSYVRTIRETLAQSPARCLPVVDDSGTVVGVFSESDLIKEPNIEIVMVDHNEFGQAVEGIENYRILEILDHHRLGNMSTRYPITFINRVVGATSTIIAGLYIEQKAVLTPGIAALLLAGILTDTLMLRSATTTDTDRDMAEFLAGLVNLDIETFGRDIFGSARQLSAISEKDLLGMDCKMYDACGKKFSVSQIEVNSTDELDERRGKLLAALAARREQTGCWFSALMITDITALNSLLLVDGDDEFIRHIRFPKLEQGCYVCRDILSRKKQLIPLLIEQMEAVLGTDAGGSKLR